MAALLFIGFAVYLRDPEPVRVPGPTAQQHRIGGLLHPTQMGFMLAIIRALQVGRPWHIAAMAIAFCVEPGWSTSRIAVAVETVGCIASLADIVAVGVPVHATRLVPGLLVAGLPRLRMTRGRRREGSGHL